VTKFPPGTGSDGAVPPPPGLLSVVSPKVGLIGMLIAFGLAAVSYIALGVYVTEDEPAEQPMPHVEKPTIEFVDDGQLAAMEPELIAPELEAELIEWFHGMDRKPISDREQVAEPEWAAYLLTQEVRQRMDRLPPRVFGSLDNLPAVIDEPGPYRGTLVRVWGRVERVDQATLRMRDDTREVSRIHVTDPDGIPWVATVVAAVSSDIGTGDWVKLVGAFTKLWPADARPALHLFVTRPPIESFAPVEYSEPRVEWLEQIQDSDPRTSTDLEDVPFYGMLNYVRTMGMDGYRKLRDSGELEVADLTGTQGSTPLLEAPQAWRFRPVRLRVAPIHKEFVVDESLGENPGNIAFIYRGYLVDDQNHPLLFMSPFAREEFDFESARMVDVEGFFFKRRMVQGSNDKRYYLPILIGADIRAIDVGPVGPSTDPMVVLMVVLGGTVLLFFGFVYLWRGARRENESVRLRRRRAAATPDVRGGQ
jgi:hypothetical protein